MSVQWISGLKKMCVFIKPLLTLWEVGEHLIVLWAYKDKTAVYR